VESLAFKFMDSLGTSDMQSELLPAWNGQHVENKCDSESGKNEKASTPKLCCVNAVATVHPDLINDSDEEEDDEKDQQENDETMKKEKNQIIDDSNQSKEKPKCSLSSPSLLTKVSLLLKYYLI
jgi:hypothetical protein